MGRLIQTGYRTLAFSGGQKPIDTGVFRGKKQKFIIVGVAESNPAEGFISNESPLGKALLGHKKGDIIKVRIPKGDVEYKIIDIK